MDFLLPCYTDRPVRYPQLIGIQWEPQNKDIELIAFELGGAAYLLIALANRLDLGAHRLFVILLCN